jgi:type IV pilus assembly protein PilY1
MGTFTPSNAAEVECLADEGVHGPDASSGNRYPTRDISSSAGGVWAVGANQSWWGVTGNVGVAVTLYSANYIRYNRNPPRITTTRAATVRAAVASFLNGLPNVNVGLMRYSINFSSGDAEGGMLLSEISPLAPKLNAVTGLVNSIVPAGGTPLSETLLEAYRYFSGAPVRYGNNSKICTSNFILPDGNGQCVSGALFPFPSVANSRSPAQLSSQNYDSPADQTCQQNYIVYITDGLPTSDRTADTEIKSLPDFNTLTVGCDATDSNSEPGGDNSGRCLGALAEYMYNGDVRPSATDPGQQKVTTFFIGLGEDFSDREGAAYAYLDRAALKGSGGTTHAFQGQDLSALTSAFNAITANVFQTSATLTPPSVTVDAFNRTQTLNDLYFSLFSPSPTLHWPGNIKKYRFSVAADALVDANGQPAIDMNTGLFSATSRSIWSDSVDGADVAAGGAANRLPDPNGPVGARRNVYTYLGTNPAPGSPVNLTTGTDNLIDVTNAGLTTAMLMIGGTSDPSRADLINFARGVDVQDDDGDPNTTTRRVLGDPIHSPATVVTYGGTAANPNPADSIVFVTTNDGYLHAFNTDTGIERWAFIPKEQLGRLKELYRDDPVGNKQYALDGAIRVLKFDINNDGVVDSGSGDRVILYFGTGRGGNRYYALDVTFKDSPRFLWSIGPSELPGVGQTWSMPSITRVNIAGATQNSQKFVLVMGGGYDIAEDSAIYLTAASVGNRVYMVDALRGTLLWSAGRTGADLNLTKMDHSIPSAVAVMDSNSDGFADRMYVGDTAAQLWRFDISNGQEADSLVAGGVIASLGTHDIAVTPSAARRFYSVPDIAMLQAAGRPAFINIAIGSGHLGHPLNTVIEDRFYSIRDRNLLSMTQAQYDALTPTTDSGLQDVTSDLNAQIPATGPGWKLVLKSSGVSGEKSLGRSVTFDNKIFFTTFIPPSGSTGDGSCLAPTSAGSNRLFVVNAFNASPIDQSRFETLSASAIVPEVTFLVPRTEPDAEVGAGGSEDGGEATNNPSTATGNRGRVVCFAAGRSLEICKNAPSRLKTYWREVGAN